MGGSISGCELRFETFTFRKHQDVGKCISVSRWETLFYTLELKESFATRYSNLLWVYNQNQRVCGATDMNAAAKKAQNGNHR